MGWISTALVQRIDFQFVSVRRIKHMIETGGYARLLPKFVCGFLDPTNHILYYIFYPSIKKPTSSLQLIEILLDNGISYYIYFKLWVWLFCRHQ